MKTLSINAEKFYLPGSWNELTHDQLLRIAELSQDERTEQDFKLKALLSITGLRMMEKNSVIIDDIEHFYIRTPGKNVYLLSVVQLYEVCEYLNFLFQYQVRPDGSAIWELSSKLTKNRIGTVNVNDKIWHGPADGLSNIKVSEFIRAEVSLSKFYETKDIRYLRLLFSTLWRPAAKQPISIDIREEYDDGLVEKRSMLTAKIPLKILFAVMIFYLGCRRMLSVKFKYASDGKDSSNDKDVFMSFMRMVNGLAENDVTKHEAVRQTYLIEMMVTIDEIARQNEELKEKTKKLRHGI